MHPGEHRIFDNRRLLPEDWKSKAGRGPIWCFNPAILTHRNGWAMAYRVVLGDGLRRIALCQLDANLSIVEGSQSPLSDQLRFRHETDPNPRIQGWFADPRLMRIGGRTWVHWNSGWHEPENKQFVHELHGPELRPAGHARELLLDGPRRKIEKNWVFPEGKPGVCVYSASPHTLLAFDPGTAEDWRMQPLSSTDWDEGGTARDAGGLRGGCPPLMVGDKLLSICHAVTESACGYRYSPLAYTWSAEPPHAPLSRPRSPLPLPNPSGPRNLLPRLNPAVGEVLYPSGAVLHPEGILVSYGINDEACALALLRLEDILDTQEPV